MSQLRRANLNVSQKLSKGHGILGSGRPSMRNPSPEALKLILLGPSGRRSSNVEQGEVLGSFVLRINPVLPLYFHVSRMGLRGSILVPWCRVARNPFQLCWTPRVHGWGYSAGHIQGQGGGPSPPCLQRTCSALGIVAVATCCRHVRTKNGKEKNTLPPPFFGRRLAATLPAGA